MEAVMYLTFTPASKLENNRCLHRRRTEIILAKIRVVRLTHQPSLMVSVLAYVAARFADSWCCQRMLLKVALRLAAGMMTLHERL